MFFMQFYQKDEMKKHANEHRKQAKGGLNNAGA